MKNILAWLNNIFNLAEERNSKFEDRSIEIMFSILNLRNKNLKIIKKNKQGLAHLSHFTKNTNLCWGRTERMEQNTYLRNNN